MKEYKELILCKYGEIVLKGLNRGYFEDLLQKELERRLRGCGNFKVYKEQSTAYIEPVDESADIEEALERAKTVFGFATVTRACVVERPWRPFLMPPKTIFPAICRA